MAHLRLSKKYDTETDTVNRIGWKSSGWHVVFESKKCTKSDSTTMHKPNSCMDHESLSL
jgi:hypothetical protein